MTKPSYRSPTYYELAAPPDLDWRPFRPPSYFAYRTEWDRRGLKADPGDFPLHLDVDPTNRCNLKCPMCPRTYYLERGEKAWAPKGLGDMDFDLYARLIAEGAAKGLKSVKLNFLGEPLLYPKLTEMVELAAKASLWVMLNTNAVALTPELSRGLLLAGLTDIFFSFDSPYPKEYEAIRKGAKYAEVLARIETFMETKKSLGLKAVQTRASMVLPEDPHGREDIKADYVRLFRGLGVAEIGFGLPTVLDRDYQVLNPKTFVCPDLFRRLFVYQDGVYGPCCGDWLRRLDIGDTSEYPTLSQAWLSQKLQALRAAHQAGQYRTILACQTCSVPYLSTLEV